MIIVFDIYDEELIKSEIIEAFHRAEGIQFCLVNNNCEPLFGEMLIDIADECENVSVIHIKKNKGTSLAVRAGSRYLNSHFNLKFLGYLVNLRGKELVKAIDLFANHYEEIRDAKPNHQLSDILKPSFFKKAFSIANYYQQINYKWDIK